MEFLMTYGWAILIIAVVLAILFKLDIFGLGGAGSVACITQAGYTCQAATLITDGSLTFGFGQISGFPIYNVEFACSGSVATSGFPNPLVFNGITSTGVSVPAMLPGTTGNQINNAQVLTISSLPCYGSGGQSLAGAALGTS
jgi:hypothetical protein